MTHLALPAYYAGLPIGQMAEICHHNQVLTNHDASIWLSRTGVAPAREDSGQLCVGASEPRRPGWWSHVEVWQVETIAAETQSSVVKRRGEHFNSRPHGVTEEVIRPCRNDSINESHCSTWTLHRERAYKSAILSARATMRWRAFHPSSGCSGEFCDDTLEMTKSVDSTQCMGVIQ